MNPSFVMSAIVFDLSDLFPVPSEDQTYADAQRHSSEVDLCLGLRTKEIEEALYLNGSKKPPDSQHWIGLPTQTLLTPYTELRKILSLLDLRPGDRVVDLGAGYGRMGFVLASHYPEVDFIGYEVVQERVIEAKRCLENRHCRRAVMYCEDLSAPGFEPVSAGFYFIYDYGSRSAVVKTLNDLQKIAKSRSITVIGRGRLSRDLIEQETPWLSQVNASEHHGNFSIYRS
jgi:hypothetical protein